MAKKEIFFKSFLPQPPEFDFNEISGILDRNNFSTRIVSNWKTDYMLQSVFQIFRVHLTPEFNPLWQEMEKKFNPEKLDSNFDMFFCMSSGVSGPVLIDAEESVHIIQVKGTVVYKLVDKMYELNPGDMLNVPSGELHQAIGLTPRITLSYGRFVNRS